MSGNSINFDDKKINKSNFHKKKIHLNTSLDKMIIMLLDHYV